MEPAQEITFTKHAARRIVQREIDAAALVKRLEEAIRAGFLRHDSRKQTLEFGDLRVVCAGLVVITVIDRRRSAWHHRAKLLARRKGQKSRKELREEIACE